AAKGEQENEAKHWHYEISVLGYKYNMNDVMAAIGLAQLKKLDRLNARRREIIRTYLAGIKNLKDIRPIFPYTTSGNESYWYFGIRCPRRDDLIIHLKKNGIATGVHFFPLPLQPLFRPYDNGCPVAKEIWQTFITLPSHADLTKEEVDYVIRELREFESQSKKG
ncbi:MAG: DegT/DnrJ/EryC1/StrS family aminotransferase, partial [Desulfobacterales bacterium]|nr:DegT/DnrJ/EryC1/StrS family aminotransferase [Desulfobacterales bacterium]